MSIPSFLVFFFSSRRRHTIWPSDWSSDVCSSDLLDIESTKYAQRDSEAAEVNSWVYGVRPSRSRMYAVSIPVTVALAAYAGYLKASLSEDGKSGSVWKMPLWGLSVGHAVA